MIEKFTLDGLHCANCGEKIRVACASIDGVRDAALNLALGTLMLECETEIDGLCTEIQRICDRIEDGITVIQGDNRHSHNHGGRHGDNCNGGNCHEHEHEHEHGHEHVHEHVHGHEHGAHAHSAIGRRDIVIIAVCSVFTVMGLVLSLLGSEVISAVLLTLSAAVAVARPAISGLRSLAHFDIDEKVLLTIAVVAAVIIGEYAEAALVSILFSIGEYIEAAVAKKSRTSLEKLSEIRPDTVHTDCGDRRADSAKIGDIIIIRPFERIPLDCTVVSGTGEIDASAITGESVPVAATDGTALLGGMKNGSGVLRARVTGDYHDSAAARIIRLVEESVASKGASERFITKFAKIYTPCVVIAAVLTTLIPSLVLGEFSVEWLRKSLVFLVASCPCALVISVPIAFYAGVGAASRAGVLIKGGVHIESLAAVRSAAFDKTGTLTTGELSVAEVVNLTDCDVLSVAAFAEGQSDHPIARAICAACENPASLSGNITERAGYGIEVAGEHTYLIGAARLMHENGIDISSLPQAAVYVACDGTCLGCISVADTPRKDVNRLITGLAERKFNHVAMLTGDSAAAAKTVAAQCGIDEVHAELLPEDKVSLLEQMSNTDRGALFVGDGINDAPVIAAATVGVAMGLGTDAAIETADVVLTAGNPVALLSAIDISRRTMSIVRFNIALSIAVKLAVMISAFFIPMMWAAVVADVVLSVVCSANSARIMKHSRS